MTEPLPFAIWGPVRATLAPDELMKFTLIYDGDLPAGQNKRALYAGIIRNKLHAQMRDLWDNHVLMRQLKHEARVNNHALADLAVDVRPPVLPDYTDPPPPLRSNQIDLCAPMTVSGAAGTYLPIVRESLHLACAIDILFLRHEEPMHIFEQSGDIDNRLKCFFDGLTMPNQDQAKAGPDPCADPLCVLLQDDKRISDFSVRSGRLFGKTDDKGRYDVRIQADITIKVLRVFGANQGLMGG